MKEFLNIYPKFGPSYNTFYWWIIYLTAIYPKFGPRYRAFFNGLFIYRP